MRYLKQSTSVDVPIGPFLDTADGFTPMTALTITQPDVRLKKNAGAWAQKNAAQTLSHEENGFYEVTLDATDTNTLGLLRLAVNETGAVIVWEDFHVVSADEYDSLFTTSGRAEPGQEAPGATIGWMKKLDFLYKWTRNKSDAGSGVVQHYADNGTTVDQKYTLVDATGTTTKGEIATGP